MFVASHESGLIHWHIPAIVSRNVDERAITCPKSRSGETSTTKNGEGGRIKKPIPCARSTEEAHDRSEEGPQMVEVLNGLTARDALCLLVQTVLGPI